MMLIRRLKAKELSPRDFLSLFVHAAEKVLVEDMPVVPVYHDNRKILEKPYVKGVIRSLVANYLREAYIE